MKFESYWYNRICYFCKSPLHSVFIEDEIDREMILPSLCRTCKKCSRETYGLKETLISGSIQMIGERNE